MSKIKHYSLLIIGILIIIAMLYLTGIENFITEVSKANLFLIGTAAFLYLFTFPLRGLVVHLVLGPYKNKANLWESTKTVFVGQFTNMLLPSRLGDIARSIYLKKKCNIPLRIGIPNVILDRLWDLIGIVSIAIISIIINPTLIQTSELGTLLIAIFLVISVFLSIKYLHVIIKMTKPLIVKLTKRFKIQSKIENLEDDVLLYVKEITSNKKLTVELLIISTVLWGIECLTAYIIFLSIGYPIEISIVLSVITLANLTKILPTTPQGIGTYEAAVVLLFGYFGIAAEIALTVAIIDHLMKNILTAILGGFIIKDISKFKI